MRLRSGTLRCFPKASPTTGGNEVYMSISKPSIAVRMLLAVVIVMPSVQSAGQQQTLTKKELKALIASAKTPADHELIAEHYRFEAKRLAAKQQEHERQLAE